MDLRKIQLTGGSSYSITLPKRWVATAGLASGDVVACDVLPDGRLVIQSGTSTERAPRTFEIQAGRKRGEHVFRGLVAGYLMGYDILRVRGKPALTREVREAVQEAARRVIGLEVVEEDATHMVLQDFLDPAEFHIPKALRRMVSLTRAMHEEAIAATVSRNEAPLRAVMARDDEVDRLYWMVNKQYHTILSDPAFGEKMNLSASQGLNFLLLARLVERTADHAARIADNLLALSGERVPADVLEEVSGQHRRALELFNRGITAFFALDREASHALIDEAKSFRDAQHRVLTDLLALKGEKLVHLAYVLESVTRTAAYAADVAETALNHEAGLKAEGKPPAGRDAD